MADTIREFLVALGFKVDGTSYKNFQNALDDSEKKTGGLGESLEGLAGRLTQVAAVFTAAGATIAAVTTQIASGFDKLYFQSQNLSATGQEIKGLEYAFGQLGGSAADADQALSSLAMFRRHFGQGADRALINFGVDPSHLNDSLKTLMDLEKRFQTMAAQGQEPQAFAIGKTLGLSDNTMMVLLKDNGEALKEYEGILARTGFSYDRAEESGNRYMSAVRQLSVEFGLLKDEIGAEVIERALPYLERFLKWIGDISAGKQLPRIAKELLNVWHAVEQLGGALADLASTPYIQNFAEKMTSALNHVIRSLSSLVKLITDVLNHNWGAALLDVQSFGSETAAAVVDTTKATFGIGDDAYRTSGKNGRDGAPGHAGRDGERGISGRNGAVGRDGASGSPGRNGRDGAPAAPNRYMAGYQQQGAGNSRAERNNNPGNIEARNKHGQLNRWVASFPGYMGDDGRFAIFANIEAGYAGQIRVLANYLRQGVNTLGSMITKYAPKGENDTAAYIARVARALGMDPNARVQIGDLDRIARVMDDVEAGHKNTGLSRVSNSNVNQTNNFHIHGENGQQMAQDVIGHQQAANQRLFANLAPLAQ